jgi:hypothetical protein
MFDERTAKKGSDEVISCMTMLLRDKLPRGVASVDICCDGCAGQSWNNRLALFLEEIVDPESGKSLLKLLLVLIAVFSCVVTHNIIPLFHNRHR